MCSKSSRIFVPENKRNVEIENDLHYKQNEADDGMHDGDLEDGNNEDRKCLFMYQEINNEVFNNTILGYQDFKIFHGI